MWSEPAEVDLTELCREKITQLQSASQKQLFYKPPTAVRTVYID